MAAIKNSKLDLRLLNCYFKKIQCFSTNGLPWRETGSEVLTASFGNAHHDQISCRTFFNFSGGISDKKKEYSGRTLVGYSMEQMYNVVSDVKSYTKFVPFCKRSVILSSRPGHMKADLVIGFPPIVESYTSSVTLAAPHLVKAVCTEGKLFNHLITLWKFSPGLKTVSQSCVVDFSTSFEFRSVLHSQLAHMFFNEVVRQMEGAFLVEATRRFGQPAVKAQKLSLFPAKT